MTPLYYQIVAHDLFPDDRRWAWVNNKWVRDANGTKNADPNYKWLGEIINNGRLAGLIDWDRIEDRGRNLLGLSHWSSPAHIIRSAADGFRIDKWNEQQHRPECFPPEAPIWILGETKPIGDVQVGDHILSHTGQMRRVTEVYQQHYSGPLTIIHAVGILPVRCTPEHPVFVVPYDERSVNGGERRFHPPCFKRACDLSRFDLLAIPRIKETDPTSSVFMECAGPRSRPIACSRDASLMTVLGLYIAEGCIKPDGRTVQFVLNQERTDLADQIESWCQSVEVTTHKSSGPGTIIILAFSKTLANYLIANCGHGSYQKRLPGWSMRIEPELQMAFIHAYFEGDGCFTEPTRIRAATRSRTLAFQLQMVLARCGYPSSVDSRMDHGRPQYSVGIGGDFAIDLAGRWGRPRPEGHRHYSHLRIDDDFAYHPVRSIGSEPYDGEVFNLEVDTDHTYCSNVAVHNCWVEKEALVGVVARICTEYDVPYFACKGYVSQSEMWGAGKRLAAYRDRGQTPYVIHLGDHDPSGIDMSRDIRDRIAMFAEGEVEVDRIALNMAQVQQYGPPPSPAKITDSRCEDYIDRFGDESWELDALDPTTLSDLIRASIEAVRDEDQWDRDVEKESVMKASLLATSRHWSKVAEFVKGIP